jgi:flagellar biosynthesis/type III secretory pathway protein FliH
MHYGTHWLITDTPRAGYAAYFDYQRRNQAEFRRNLRRNERKQARVAKEEAEASTQQQRQSIRSRVQEANEDGFPSGVEEREAFFNEQVMAGEMLSQDRACALSLEFVCQMLTIVRQLPKLLSLLWPFTRVSRSTLLLAT